jgi:uncharacterized protein YndB with AHSA1/START domain
MSNNNPVQDLVVSRIFNAPLELVWKLWTDPEQVKTWWGPAKFTSPTCKIDLREGGTYLFCMHSPEDQGDRDFYSTGTYQKIVPRERLEFTQSFSDKNGTIIPPAQMGMPDMPEKVQTVVTFKDLGGGKTEMTITQSDQPAGQMFEFAVAGWNQSFDKMAASLQENK